MSSMTIKSAFRPARVPSGLFGFSFLKVQNWCVRGSQIYCPPLRASSRVIEVTQPRYSVVLVSAWCCWTYCLLQLVIVCHITSSGMLWSMTLSQSREAMIHKGSYLPA